MSELKKLYLVRHGHYKGMEDENVMDAELSVSGIAETTKLAENLIYSGIEKIYSSPYLRTIQTAAILARVLNINYDTDERFKETTHATSIVKLEKIYKDFKQGATEILSEHEVALIVSHELPLSLFLSKERGIPYIQMLTDYSHYLRKIETGECLLASFMHGSLVDVVKV